MLCLVGEPSTQSSIANSVRVWLRCERLMYVIVASPRAVTTPGVIAFIAVR